MPGLVMDDSGSQGMRQHGGDPIISNGIPGLSMLGDGKGGNATQAPSSHMPNGSVLPNGVQAQSAPPHENGDAMDIDEQSGAPHDPSPAEALASEVAKWPPEIERVPPTAFFHLGTMISRVSQRALIDLDDMVEKLANIDVPPQNPPNSQGYVNGVTPTGLGNQSSANLDKKDLILKFAKEKRDQFIKLLVISEWSKQAEDVNKAIDINVWIHTQIDLYNRAINDVGEMKRRVAMERMPPPDLDTAIEVLTTGKVSKLSDLGLIPLKPLSTKKILKTLRKMNTLLSVKLALLDEFPPQFRKYKVHDGRVTFTVPTEFELDLTIGEEDRSSPFFFIDLRFLFTPSSPVPESALRSQIEYRANEILRQHGLKGCFDFVHDLVLTDKVGALRRQAGDLVRAQWTETLRIDFHHRTLVVQYWIGRPGPKSWLEIGLKSGRRKENASSALGIPFVDIRWLREKVEQDKSGIKFDLAHLSMVNILRSIVAQHISHILTSIYHQLMEGGMYKNGKLLLWLTTSRLEPLDCQLVMQLTKGKSLQVRMEPTTGKVFFTPPLPQYIRFERELNSTRELVKDGGKILGQLRCVAVKEDIEYRARTTGWEVLQTVRLAEEDRKKYLPKDILTLSVLRRNGWKEGWHLLSTHSLSSDQWWIVQVKKKDVPKDGQQYTAQSNLGFGLFSVRAVDTKYIEPPSTDLTFDYFHRLGSIVSGLITLEANLHGFTNLRVSHSLQAPVSTVSETPLDHILLSFEPKKLPSLLPRVRDKTSEPWCAELLRVSFQGLDPLTLSSKVLVQGVLTYGNNSLAKLNNNDDDSVLYNPDTKAFAFHLDAPVGTSVAKSILTRLQRMERLISCIEILKRCNVEPDHVSLANVVFTYNANLRAHINFESPSKVSHIIKSNALGPSKPGSAAKMIIDFSTASPHLHIQDHLISILNDVDGLEDVALLLNRTLPALQGLDDIEQSYYQGFHRSSQHKSGPELLITYRAADSYVLHYVMSNTSATSSDESASGTTKQLPTPDTSFSNSSPLAPKVPQPVLKFVLRLRQRRDQPVWHLSQGTSTADMTRADALSPGLSNYLKEKIFDNRGQGWRGEGSGVIAHQHAGLMQANEEDATMPENTGVRGLLKELNGVVLAAIELRGAQQTSEGDGNANTGGNDEPSSHQMGGETGSGNGYGADDAIMIE